MRSMHIYLNILNMLKGFVTGLANHIIVFAQDVISDQHIDSFTMLRHPEGLMMLQKGI
jgi:hypothetical protein